MIWIWNFSISYPWRNILIDIDFIRKINKKMSIIYENKKMGHQKDVPFLITK